ncbi:hypothetical protein KKF05_04185 [Patescibacteria group bacterium]|nr:hypothetical protein [Patescibacteria group bacterium]MBU1028669.1 hypothetical protein [Patescibacteria group bacterium]MBU1915706.1 hypothetical protein [Patescibacteria group bacterium]
MSKITYLLIPAVLFFGLFFGLARNGAHDLMFGNGMVHMACEGNWCSVLPDITCSVHCLTSGIAQSFGFSLADVAPLIGVVLLISVLGLVSQSRFHRVLVVQPLGLSPPSEIILKIQKKE